MRIALMAAIAILLGGAKPAPQPISLEPVANWKVDYSTSSCVLTRQFVAGDQRYDFELTFTPIEKRARLRLGSPEKPGRFDSGDAAVEVDGVKLAEPTHFNVFASAKGGTTREFLFLQFGRDVGHTDRSLRLRPTRYGDFILDVPDFPGAMRAMGSCMDDLYHTLGIDPAVLRSIAVNPEGRSMQFVRSPGREFDMQLLYWVTTDGKVDECKVLKPSGIDEFDQRFCEELKASGRFKPAKSTAGLPMRAPVFEDVSMRTKVQTSTSPL